MENISFKRRPVFLKFRMVTSMAGDRSAEEKLKDTRDVYLSPGSITSFFPLQGFDKTHTQLCSAGAGFFIVEGDAEDIFFKVTSSVQDEMKGTMSVDFE